MCGASADNTVTKEQMLKKHKYDETRPVIVYESLESTMSNYFLPHINSVSLSRLVSVGYLDYHC